MARAGEKEKEYIQLQCPHCFNAVAMEVVASYSNVCERTTEKLDVIWDEGHIYQVLKCPACSEVTFQRSYYHSILTEYSESETLYPTSAKEILGLPPKIKTGYQAALKVKSIDANAYAVLLGRVLELLCVDKGAEGNTLYLKFLDLNNKEIIPKSLADMAQSLRAFRNIGAHAELGDVTSEEIPFLEDLACAILEYVYSGPELIAIAQRRLEVMKGTSNEK